ncbi:MAG TPA: AAA family ATPase [Chloroflexi bacterium]|jgi:chloramphenicol 3-O-phosphotransferase|nr:AAA family ATPase [Chloroflexota bacterium]
MEQAIIVITGIMAAGKSTVAEALAHRIPKATHLRGDIFRRMIISGREEMTDHPTDEALRQLYMRYELAAMAAGKYYENGFTVVVQDNYLGRALQDFIAMLEGYPLYVIVLYPGIEVVERREAQRDKKGYGGFDVAGLYRSFMAETPRLGLWLDNGELTVEETVETILRRINEARIGERP